MINLDQNIRIAATFRFQWEEAQQCHVLLFPEGMVQLNGPAAEILKLCPTANSDPCQVSELVTQLQAAFPDADGIEADVLEFLAVADDKGWITLG